METETETSFKKLSEVLEHIENAHHRVTTFVVSCDCEFRDQQRTLLIQSIEQDQQRIERVIHSYRDANNDKKLSNEWVQFVPEQQLADAVERIEQLETPSFDELVERILDFYQDAQKFIQTIRQQAPSGVSKVVLDDLELLELQNAKALSERLLGLEDS